MSKLLWVRVGPGLAGSYIMLEFYVDFLIII